VASARATFASDGPTIPSSLDYQVVARRYRPQSFADVVGQDHVVRALSNAIIHHRVTHAYLFCGTRGVGKTSMARIFAKCLNCERGPTVEPCQVCDICRAISVGQDVDVIEIDGASNNGVDAVRELRQNAGLRPSRARYKIYYIDEVHMLTTGAFNALLKTLEEPPEHVKFIFATTEAHKIPITVLSRCQRYDFASITPDTIQQSLAAICQREGIAAESEALRVVARRASGSMRDAQSLLEQLLSSGQSPLTVEMVHQLLGTPDDELTLEILDALAGQRAGEALCLFDQAAGRGVQALDLINSLMDALRDVMTLAAGAPTRLLSSSPRHHDRLKRIATTWGLDTTLAALQVASEARGKLRGSLHGRLIAEMTLVRIARLERLAALSDLIAHLSLGEPLDPTRHFDFNPTQADAELPPKLVAPTPLPTITPPPSTGHDHNAPTETSNNEKKKFPAVVAPTCDEHTDAPTAPDVKLTPPTGQLQRVPSAGDTDTENDHDPDPDGESPSPSPSWDERRLQDAWRAALEELSPRERRPFLAARVHATSGPDHVHLILPASYNPGVGDGESDRIVDRLATRMATRLGRLVRLVPMVDGKPEPDRPPQPDRSRPTNPRTSGTAIQRDSSTEVLRDDPFVRRLIEVFEARQVLAEPNDAESSSTSSER